MEKKEINEQIKDVNIVRVEPEPKVVCPVCGHANNQYNSLCEMCSTYLK